jgi:quinone-modifying oxidoreductase subunit QmoC
MTTESNVQQESGPEIESRPKAPVQKIEPDLEFIREVTASGGDTLKKCFQCATCSVVCELTPSDHPFPRKEMIWASWGLKDRLMSDGDVWLCHQCGDCSTNCPRGAKPADTFAAIRAYLFKNLAFPKFLGTWLSDPKYLPLVLGIPAVWLLIMLAAAGTITTIPKGEIEFSKFLPHTYLYIIFIVSTHAAALLLVVSLVKFWKLLSNSSAANGASHSGGATQGNMAASAFATAKEILTHDKFKKCEQNNQRYLGHLGIMYGFLMIAIGTGIAFFMMYALGIHPPFGQFSPPKVLGHLGLIALVAGLIVVIRQRLAEDSSVTKTSYQDWYLLLMLLTVAVTGQLVELVRIAGVAWLAYWGYIVHLVFVFALIGYFPYSKFAHMFYRFVAIMHSKYSGRDASVNETGVGQTAA